MVTRTKKSHQDFQRTDFFFIGVNISFAFHHKLKLCTIILLLLYHQLVIINIIHLLYC